MVPTFSGTDQCRNIAQPNKNGFLKVTYGDVIWKVFVGNGRLRYANHSVQSLDSLNYHLAQLGHEVINQLVEDPNATDPTSWGALSLTADHLFQQGKLNAQGLVDLKNAIARDALESLIWLSEGTVEWHNEPNAAASDDMPELNGVLEHLEVRLKSWQQLMPGIQSPHQQPYCPSPERLSQPVPNGMLNPGLLAMLAKLMQNRSISELSIFLKQDNLKIAQLLAPYIRHGVIQLKPAASPLSQLPKIPAPAATPQAAVPQATASSQQPAATAAAPADGATKRPTIVCIDDSPAMLETIEGYLGAEGFAVATVENPMESLSTMFAMKPDLILMDVSMPGINGNRLCQILRRSSVFKEVPIVMVSGNTGALDKAKAESSGATDYLTKPFSKADLLAIVDAHIKTAVCP